jgi:feruloyl esterase
MDFAIDLNPGGVAFYDPDLSEFHANGGKIIAYHGRSDQTITSILASEYFTNIQAALDLSVDEMLSFYRLFLIPGHTHCRGGVGAWNVGQAFPLDEQTLDVAHNALLALVEWVEEGRKPDELVGTKYTDDDVTKPVLTQRSKSSQLGDCIQANTSQRIVHIRIKVSGMEREIRRRRLAGRAAFKST